MRVSPEKNMTLGREGYKTKSTLNLLWSVAIRCWRVWSWSWATPTSNCWSAFLSRWLGPCPRILPRICCFVLPSLPSCGTTISRLDPWLVSSGQVPHGPRTLIATLVCKASGTSPATEGRLLLLLLLLWGTLASELLLSVAVEVVLLPVVALSTLVHHPPSRVIELFQGGGKEQWCNKGFYSIHGILIEQGWQWEF